MSLVSIISAYHFGAELYMSIMGWLLSAVVCLGEGVAYCISNSHAAASNKTVEYLNKHNKAMQAYYWIKLIHILTVIISFSLFFIRGYWVVVDSPRLDRRWVKILPHVNDSILLLSAISLTVLISQYPFVQGWLTAKVTLLVVYIGLGTIAIKRGKTKSIRVSAWLAALAVFAYIVLIALNKSSMPLGF